MRRVILMMLVGMLLLAACSANGNSSSNGEEETTSVPTEYAGLTNPLGADAAGQGAELFKSNCQTCHGPQGHGDGPAGQALDPKPEDLTQLQTKVGDDFLFWRIREGKPGTSMLAWKGILTDAQTWQLVSFIRILK